MKVFFCLKALCFTTIKQRQLKSSSTLEVKKNLVGFLLSIPILSNFCDSSNQFGFILMKVRPYVDIRFSTPWLSMEKISERKNILVKSNCISSLLRFCHSGINFFHPIDTIKTEFVIVRSSTNFLLPLDFSIGWAQLQGLLMD